MLVFEILKIKDVKQLFAYKV